MCVCVDLPHTHSTGLCAVLGTVFVQYDYICEPTTLHPRFLHIMASFINYPLSKPVKAQSLCVILHIKGLSISIYTTETNDN